MITSMRFNSATTINRNKSNSAQAKPNINFCARPEYEKLLRDNTDVSPLTSSFFRRFLERFPDVISSIKIVMKQEQTPKILIVGIAHAQEPFSYLAVIKNLKKRKQLASIIDLNCVDLQPKISDKNLEEYAYLSNKKPPRFAKKSFDYIENPNYKKELHYKVKPDILNHLKEVFNSPEKTKWDTKIEEFAESCPEKTYNMVSMNNVLMYVEDDKEKERVIKNISKILKKDGIFITDMGRSIIENGLKDFKERAPGIWQKLK